MANHVWSYIEFHNEDEATEAALYEHIENVAEEAKKYAEEQERPYSIFGDGVHELMTRFGCDVPPEDEMDRSWYCDNVGAKWCHLEDISDSYIATNSAWSPPFELATALCEAFSKSFPGTYSIISFEDECWNFVGTAVINEEGVDEIDELDSDEIMAKFEEENNVTIPEEGIFEDDDLREQFEDWIMAWKENSASNNKTYYEAYLREIREEEDLIDKENLPGC